MVGKVEDYCYMFSGAEELGLTCDDCKFLHIYCKEDGFVILREGSE